MRKKALFSLFAWLMLSPLLILILFPYAVMISTALKPRTEIFIEHVQWLPQQVDFAALQYVITSPDFQKALWNSVVIASISGIVTLIVALPGAYALSRYQFSGKKIVRQILLIGQMISPIILVLGIFRLAVALGVINSVSGLAIILVAINTSFVTWILQNYFDTIPKELEEAAYLDGASVWRIMIQIFLPLALPALGVGLMFTFINAWNEFVLALTMLRDNETHTLPVYVYNLRAGFYVIEWNVVMAATFLTTIPIGLVCAFLQKSFVAGLSQGSEK